MIILYHKYKDKYPDQSTSSRGSAIFSYQQSSRMLETYTPHQLIDEELRRESILNPFPSNLLFSS